MRARGDERHQRHADQQVQTHGLADLAQRGAAGRPVLGAHCAAQLRQLQRLDTQEQREHRHVQPHHHVEKSFSRWKISVRVWVEIQPPPAGGLDGVSVACSGYACCGAGDIITWLMDAVANGALDMDVVMQEQVKPVSLKFAIGISFISAVLVFVSFIGKDYGLASLPRIVQHPAVFQSYISQALGGSLGLPALNVLLASVFKSKRNSSTRRRIFIGWALVIIVANIIAIALL